MVLLFHLVGGSQTIVSLERAPFTMTMQLTNTHLHLRQGLLEYCVLHIISREEVYTSDLIDELTQAKILLVEGTVYPLLNRLKTENLLSYRWVEADEGPPRKYYSITEEGQVTLKTLAETWKGLVKSITQITKKKASSPSTIS